MHRTFRLASLASLALVALASAVAHADVRAVLSIPVTVHVLDDQGRPVATDEQVRALLRDAQHYYEGASMTFDVVVRASARRAHLESIADRRRLARDCVPHTLNIFLASQIDDPVASASTIRAASLQHLTPTGWLGGAHIPAPGRTPATYAIARANPSSIAHEMGHFFGEPHAPDPENLMSYGRERRGFDPEQIERIRARAASLLRRRVLRRIPSSG